MSKSKQKKVWQWFKRTDWRVFGWFLAVGTFLYLFVLVIFGVRASVMMDITAFTDPFTVLQESQTQWLLDRVTVAVVDPFYQFLAKNSLLFMTLLFLLVIVVFAFLIARRKRGKKTV